jgi:putative transcriptional regulator
MDLTGQILIAMPGMSDPRFSRSVVLICAHSNEGAMGLIVNKRARRITLSEVFSRLDIKPSQDANTLPVHIGGPVETQRGFVLHQDQTRLAADALTIGDEYALTATRDILNDIANGTGPEPVLFALGYTGWGPSQLEGEIGQNGWLTAAATPELVFGGAHDVMWEMALRSIGIDPITLSGTAGRA